MKENLTALITGGGRGIGEATSRMMLEVGYKVVSVGLHKPEWTHAQFQHFVLDLLDEETTRQFAKDLATEMDITHLIHNAGIILPNLLEDMHSDDLLTLTKLHAGSALILMQAFVPLMKDNGFGRVIFNSSRASVGLEPRSAYSYSKAGIIGMARTWALELAPFGVTVNTVAPGPVLTDQFWGLVEKDSAQQVKIAASLPVRRIGKPEDVARAILFFSDPENSYVTGQTLYVCGGSSIASG